MSASTPDRRRSWTGPALLVLLAAGLFAACNLAPPAVAGWLIIAYAATLLLAPAVLYPWLRGRGASPGAAVLGSLAVAIAWTIKECWAVGTIFGAGRAAYYAFNPLAAGLYLAAAVQMAVAEIVLRRRRSGRWRLRNGAGLTLLAVAGLAGAFALVATRRDPSFVFWLYIAGYRRLFGE